MHRPPGFLLLAACLSALALPVTAGEGALRIVLLRGGGQIRGEVLSQRPDRVVIDIGFAVLTVPADEIERIQEPAVDAPGVAAPGQNLGIYRVAPDQPFLSVKENVDRCAEAVVEVRTPTSLGSGFLISPEGHVVTNSHVISGEQRISVTMFRRSQDGGLERVTLHDVEILASDPSTDLALLRIRDAGGPLPSVPLGDSASIRQGQPVFAVGSPLGLERSVSEGIVSLRSRLVGSRLLLQSTTQLNPGNSGGPLLNLRGEVVGVNNLKVLAAGIEGLSFSVPVDVLKLFLSNRDAFSFDPRNPNAGFRYHEPPRPADTSGGEAEGD